jgi:hypothetical protein
MTRWPIITGGRAEHEPPAPARTNRAYYVAANAFGRTYVYFSWSPSANVLDCVMLLADAVAHGFIVAPQRVTLRLAQAVGR